MWIFSSKKFNDLAKNEQLRQQNAYRQTRGGGCSINYVQHPAHFSSGTSPSLIVYTYSELLKLTTTSNAGMYEQEVKVI